MSRERFEELIEEAVLGLPEWVRERLENVEILVEEHPPPNESRLLGRYEGIPLTRRGRGYSGVLPDRITLFRSRIERTARDDEQLKERIRHVVVHEIAHFFGISDDRLRELDRY